MKKMVVFDEFTGKAINMDSARRVVVNQLPDNLIFGYTQNIVAVHPVGFWDPRSGRFYTYDTLLDNFKDVLVYSNLRGCYLSPIGAPDAPLYREIHTKGHGGFPYNFARRYEAVESFNIFKNKQVIENPEPVKFLEEFKYTFGLEFETSAGYIPELRCFRDGLIPLRDGSITGLEYSTVVLKGSDGFNLLKQQLADLKQYTNFNADCSLHVHLGGFPLESEKIFRLFTLCRNLERDLYKYVPEWTFNTAQYKSNQKDYCKRLFNVDNFDQLYEALAEQHFYGSFTQAHPKDVERKAKWNIHTRYYWLNLINALCYKVNKTIEFRFLRPTFSYEKIVTWLFILNAILRYAEDTSLDIPSNPRLESIISAVYPEPLYKKVSYGLSKLAILKENQAANGDRIGADIYSEQQLFKW